MKCIVCGNSDFDSTDDKSHYKCKRCGKEYFGGYDELVKLNERHINNVINETKKEIQKDLEDDLTKIFRNAFKGNKNIKFK